MNYRVRRFVLPIFLLLSAAAAQSATVQVDVGAGGAKKFTPSKVTIQPGDTVQWVWQSNHHSVTSGTSGNTNGLFDSGIHNPPFSFSHTFSTAGTFPYFCLPHFDLGMEGSVEVITPPGVLGNISTRSRVGADQDVMVGGFITDGTGPKQLVIRALGPTLAQFGIADVLQNPTLELHNSMGGIIASNDDWAQAANAQSIPANLRPPDSHESALLVSLTPGSYTAIVRGANNTTGVALVEVYDIDSGATSHLSNISTRSLVQTGTSVMIAGLVVQSNNENVLVRALGPTLANFGIINPLANPTLELRDANGTLITSNDDWKSTQQAAISATGKAPPNDLESAIVRTLAPGNYTAIVRGVNNTTGVALVEVYALQ